MYQASLKREEYQRSRFLWLALLEESGQLKRQVYLDTQHIPTIGLGFNLYRAPVMEALLRQLGLPETHIPSVSRGMLQHMNRSVISQFRDIADIRANLNAQLTALTEGRLTELALPDDAAVKAMFDRLIVDYEAELDRRFAAVTWPHSRPHYDALNLPYSWERLALVSLLYNSGLLLGPNLTRAVRTGDRERAWYEIRYGSNGGRSRSQGIANRRYIEAELWRGHRPLNLQLLTSAQRQRMQAYEAEYPPQTALDRYQSWYAQVQPS